MERKKEKKIKITKITQKNQNLPTSYSKTNLRKQWNKDIIHLDSYLSIEDLKEKKKDEWITRQLYFVFIPIVGLERRKPPPNNWLQEFNKFWYMDVLSFEMDEPIGWFFGFFVHIVALDKWNHHVIIHYTIC